MYTFSLFFLEPDGQLHPRVGLFHDPFQQRMKNFREIEYPPYHVLRMPDLITKPGTQRFKRFDIELIQMKGGVHGVEVRCIIGSP
jgi:hypothetical protein